MLSNFSILIKMEQLILMNLQKQLKKLVSRFLHNKILMHCSVFMTWTEVERLIMRNYRLSFTEKCKKKKQWERNKKQIRKLKLKEIHLIYFLECLDLEYLEVISKISNNLSQKLKNHNFKHRKRMRMNCGNGGYKRNMILLMINNTC